jgi:TetR/AcrR family transcriptional repressor of nem operon
MARPREFERDEALRSALGVFWSKGFAGTSTDDLMQAMGIGRQSLYNAFGDKRQLYLEALGAYLQEAIDGHLARLNAPASALDGIRSVLVGLIPEDAHQRGLGCMGVSSVGEFGSTDADVADLRARAARRLTVGLIARIKEGQAIGDIDRSLDPAKAAGFVQITMTGLQVSARAGAKLSELTALAGFAVDRLKSL